MPKYTVTFEKRLTSQAQRTISAKTAQGAWGKAQDIDIPDAEWDIIDEDMRIMDVEEE